MLCMAGLAIAAIFGAGNAADPDGMLYGNHTEMGAKLPARASPSRALTIRVWLALRKTAELHKLLSDMQNRASPRYHHWLTREEFNARFGRTAAEVQAVRDWLTSQSFVVVSYSPRSVSAQGTVATAERAFSTTIAASADGALYANTTDPRIPQQFVGVIGSVEGLDNTMRREPAGLRKSGSPRAGPPDFSAAESAGGPVPGYMRGGPPFNFGPPDLYTFYDETPLLNAGIDGFGADCIALPEYSDYLDASVTQFDTNFSLTAANLTRILAAPDSTNPGRSCLPNSIYKGNCIFEIESLVDIEWSHSVAPALPINVYLDGSLFDAINAPIQDDRCGVISISIGACGEPESFYTIMLDGAFAQAAAQGQSVFIAAGDNGADNCHLGTPNINEESADPNVTSVGGTQFAPNYDASGNDIGNVAEQVWNSCEMGGRRNPRLHRRQCNRRWRKPVLRQACVAGGSGSAE